MGNKTALITGATSGIGKATAQLFAQHNINLILCGRNAAKLSDLKQELCTLVNVHTLCFDVSDETAVFAQINSLKTTHSRIDILLNNAGNAHGRSTFQEGDINDYNLMIDVNVKGLIYVSKAVLPFMLPYKCGHIINIGSIAGQEVYEQGNVYNASKFAVDALTKAMRIDLIKEKIKVSQLNPGAVHTDFSLIRFKGDEDKAAKVYEGWNPLQAKDVADVIHFMVTRPAHVNIADVLLLPTAQANAYIIDK
ncbi:MAG: SDR family NAD(P)-dependent oxidoreductase [Bacteroidia bacterium]|nr:SDR family NAD(P)-dependent oxidoreductase [Bacteroidia bacterium]